MPALKFGKKPARPGAAKLKLSDYLDPSVLPAPPAAYGHETLVPDWGMLANDSLGDCAIAAPLHAIKLWAAETKRTVNVNDASAIQNYSAITGYDPSQTQPDGSNVTDQGTDVQQMLEYWRTTGLIDADGDRHQIGAYVGLSIGADLLDQLWYADYIFDGVILGINCPSQWQEAFQAGQPWDALAAPDYEGGHCILGACKRQGNLGVVTWGALQPVTPAGITQNVDEAWAVLSAERVANGVDIDGFAWPLLQADLPKLGAVK